MNCPACQTTLLMMDRQGIEIDYCPSCRGVWLDRGELDKIIERSSAPMELEPRPPAGYADRPDYRPEYKPDYPPGYRPEQRRDHDRDDDDRYKHGGGYRKKKSFWGELFDFD